VNQFTSPEDENALREMVGARAMTPRAAALLRIARRLAPAARTVANAARCRDVNLLMVQSPLGGCLGYFLCVGLAQPAILAKSIG
jgi:hypothetical protein